MTKAIRIYENGGPEVLKWEDVNVSKPGKGEVIIETRAVGLNFIDTYHRSGLYPLPSIPICPGLEASGEIIDIGSSVKNFSVGDKVCYASPPLGAYCEIRDFPEENLIKIPEYISTDQSASILLQGMTVEYLFERLYKIKKDEIFVLKKCNYC